MRRAAYYVLVSSCAGRPTTCSWSCLLCAHARGYLLLGSRRSGRLHEAEDRSAASGPRLWSPPLPTQCLLTQKTAITIYANT